VDRARAIRDAGRSGDVRGRATKSMNYVEHYERLIQRARRRTLEGYRECHHIRPRCMGGKDSTENIVELTPEEHYVAHQLLVKIYPENKGIFWAAIMMSCRSHLHKRSNKLYGWLRRKCVENMKRNTYGTALKGIPRTEDVKKRISESTTGVPKPYMRERNALLKGTQRPSVSEGMKKSDKVRRGKGSWPERQGLVSPLKGRKRPELSANLLGHRKCEMICPHCGKVGRGGTMRRWHFDNCLSIGTEAEIAAKIEVRKKLVKAGTESPSWIASNRNRAQVNKDRVWTIAAREKISNSRKRQSNNSMIGG